MPKCSYCDEEKEWECDICNKPICGQESCDAGDLGIQSDLFEIYLCSKHTDEFLDVVEKWIADQKKRRKDWLKKKEARK